MVKYVTIRQAVFVIFIPDKTTNVISWHQMDTQVELDTRLVLKTRLVLEVLWYFAIFTVTLQSL